MSRDIANSSSRGGIVLESGSGFCSGLCNGSTIKTTSSPASSRPPKRHRHVECKDEVKCHPPASPNQLRGEFLFGFPTVDSLNVSLSFLPPNELARNQIVSKQAEVRFKKAFELCETYSAHIPKGFNIEHTQYVAKYCRRLKKVAILLTEPLNDRSTELFRDSCSEIFENNKRICTLELGDLPASLLATISSFKLPLRELAFQADGGHRSLFDPNLLASSGHRLQVLNIGLCHVNVNIHDLIKSCPSLEVFSLPKIGVLEELRTTPDDCFHNLTELIVWNSMQITGVVEVIRRAPNLNKLRVRRFDDTLVGMLEHFSGESLSLGYTPMYSRPFGEMLRILRTHGVVLTHLRRFAIEGFMNFPVCYDFAAVAPNVNTILAESAGAKSMKALHNGGLRITSLLLQQCSLSVRKYLARKNVFPELEHVSVALVILRDWKNRKLRVSGVSVPFLAHFDFRLSDSFL